MPQFISMYLMLPQSAKNSQTGGRGGPGGIGKGVGVFLQFSFAGSPMISVDLHILVKIHSASI